MHEEIISYFGAFMNKNKVSNILLSQVAAHVLGQAYGLRTRFIGWICKIFQMEITCR